MRRFAKWAIGILAVSGLGLLAVSVGYVPAREFQIIGSGGQPVAAIVAFVYKGNRLNFVHSITWSRQGGIVHTGSEGLVQLPGLLYVKRPLDGWLAHRVRLLHAPSLHAALHVTVPVAGAVLVVPDRGDDPEEWDRAFGELYSLLAYDMALGESERYAVAPATVVALAQLVVADYKSFLDAHRNTPRTVPADPPAHLRYAQTAERDAWREQLRRQIAREPTWGAFMKRRYGSKIRKLEKRFGH